MRTNQIVKGLGIGLVSLVYVACNPKGPVDVKKENKNTPAAYSAITQQDTVNTGMLKAHEFFTDPYLVALIDSALKNNQELNIVTQEILIAQNEIRARKGAYLPYLSVQAGAGIDKVGRYTRNGAVEATTDIVPGKEFPEPLPDLLLAANVSWEVDIWNKLHNAKKAAFTRYLSSTEGRKFTVTQIVAEIANSYYELLALDNQLAIVKQNIEIQSNALEIVRLEKNAAKVTELAVRKFEAEVYHTRSLQFDIQQKIVEAENRINFLVGRFPQPVQRSTQPFTEMVPTPVKSGIPSQLLENRPDIKQAELDLVASRLELKSAKAQFYPSFNITAGIGYNAFNPKYFITTPQSLIYTLAGELIAPIINRSAIKAYYFSATSRQVQAAYNYERVILRAYIEVANQLSNIQNLEQSYNLKSQQVQALTQSIDISTNLFKSARADYMEVLLTQRDALESKFELIETKRQQMNAMVNIYQALGGGWR